MKRRHLEEVGTAVVACFLGVVLTVLAVVNRVDGFEAPASATPAGECTAIERGAPKVQVERHFHFGRTTKAGYVPGGQLYEWTGPGWKVQAYFAEPLNHRLPGHPV